MLSAGEKWGLVVGVGVIAACGLTVEMWHAVSHDPCIEALLPTFSLSYEGNVPTWAASALLGGSSLELVAVARCAPALRGHWRALAGLFALFSVDEVAQFHEQLGGHLDTGGILYFDWVIPGAILVVAFAAAFWRFFWALAPATRRRFAVAAAIFVAGALLTELPLGYVTERHGDQTLAYALIDFVEETLELAGTTWFLFAVSDHLRDLRAAGEDRAK
ncbi:MAG TPA: hypothetical protein VFG83_08120 [Kofleriaceae bacterium]|nr:hypothetical protein [Kofleriaceae bacterium]